MISLIYMNSKKMIKNELIYKTETNSQTSKTVIVTKGERWGEGWIGGLGLAYAHYCIWNIWSAGTCCIAQEALLIFCDDLYGKRN